MNVCEIVMTLCELVQIDDILVIFIMFNTCEYLCFLCSLCCNMMCLVLVRYCLVLLGVNMLTYDQGKCGKFHLNLLSIECILSLFSLHVDP